MDLGERLLMRIVVAVIVVGIVYVFRLIKKLLKFGWQSLKGSGNDANRIPQTPVKPPVVPPAEIDQTARNPAEDRKPQKPQEYKGTIPLGDGSTSLGIPEEQKSSDYQPYIPPVIQYTLQCLSGPYAGRQMALKPNVKYTLGRNAGCTIQFPAQTPGVSGQHCTLEVEQTDMPGKSTVSVYLTDHNSTYGTYLGNGQRLVPGNREFLPDGTVFVLGSSTGPRFQIIKTEINRS